MLTTVACLPLRQAQYLQGNLLDDTELIDVLAITKQTAGEVNERLTGASETNKKINEACEEYRPVAHRATLIYFLIAEFSVVNCMYQTSLNQFNQLYELAIDNSEKATLPSKRINNIIEYMTYEIYLYIQRGLFERHKIIFALMLTSKVLSSAGKVKAEEIDIFLKGGGALDIDSVRKKPKVLFTGKPAACSHTSNASMAWSGLISSTRLLITLCPADVVDLHALSS